MFEKYNEKARRSLFFARYEASKLGSQVIETEHVLLGLLREGEEILLRLLAHFQVRPDELRREIEGDRIFVERVSSTADLPLSEDTKTILAYALHESENMAHEMVEPAHLLIGLLRIEDRTGRLLQKEGIELYAAREVLEAFAQEEAAEEVERRTLRIAVTGTCSFCGKDRSQVGILVRSDQVHICNQCLDGCLELALSGFSEAPI